MRRVMVLVLVALGCVLFTAAPAQACDRPVPPVAKALQGSTSVFSGTVSKVTSAGDQTTYAVTVDRAYQGRVDEEVMVIAPRTKGDCGLIGIRRGDKVMFVARDGSGDRFQTRARGLPSPDRQRPGRGRRRARQGQQPGCAGPGRGGAAAGDGRP